MFPGPFGCIFWIKILRFFDVDPGRDGKTRIRDPGWKKVRSGIRDGKKDVPH